MNLRNCTIKSSELLCAKPTIIFYNPYNIWPFHLETELEIVNKHLRLGHRVVVLTCNGEISPCDQLLDGMHGCEQCVKRREYGYNKLDLASSVIFTKAVDLSVVQVKEAVEFIKQVRYRTLAELKSIRYEGLDLGMAVAASLISHLREASPSTVQHRELIQKLLFSTLSTYLSIKKLSIKESASLAYVFNGRFSVLRAAYQAFQYMGVPVVCHERAGVLNKYTLTENTTAHDLGWWKDQIAQAWSKDSPTQDEKLRLGEKWFFDRINGNDHGWSSFSKDFIASPSITSLDNYKIHCSIFITSEDEMETIESWQVDKPYENQFCALSKIFKEFAGDQAYRFTIRVHPNLKDVKNSQIAGIRLLGRKFPDVEIVEANDLSSSYDIIKSSDLVLVFGSTVGIEAAFLGKRVILAGHAFYESLNVCLRVHSHAHLVAVFSQIANGLIELDHSAIKKRATKYGYFVQSCGSFFELLHQRDPFVFQYEGELFAPQETSPSSHSIKYILKMLFFRLKKVFGL